MNGQKKSKQMIRFYSRWRWELQPPRSTGWAEGWSCSPRLQGRASWARRRCRRSPGCGCWIYLCTQSSRPTAPYLPWWPAGEKTPCQTCPWASHHHLTRVIISRISPHHICRNWTHFIIYHLVFFPLIARNAAVLLFPSLSVLLKHHLQCYVKSSVCRLLKEVTVCKKSTK